MIRFIQRHLEWQSRSLNQASFSPLEQAAHFFAHLFLLALTLAFIAAVFWAIS